MFTSDHLAAHVPALESANHIYVGYSGGLDSHVLLHLVISLVGTQKVTALHINHQLSPNADQWQSHCSTRCKELGVNLQSFRVDVKKSGNGVEQAARDARYQIFEAALGRGDLLLLAHHADDQAETVLYRMLRCSGPRGLAAMPEHRTLGEGQLLRPLLNIPRATLEGYAKEHGLSWIDDESNELLDFDRNFLRHKVVPILKERWPDLAERFSQVAHLCRQTDDLTRELAEADLDDAGERKERLGVSVDMESLKSLSVARRHNLVRFWCERHGYRMPAQIRLERIHRELIEAREDGSPIIAFGDCELRRFAGRIYLLPPLSQAPDSDREVPWSGCQELVVEGAGSVQPISVPKSEYVIRFRRGGERCQPVGRDKSQSLKKILQELQVEPWLRERLPLIYRDEQLVAVAGLFVCEEGYEVGWKPAID